MLKCEVCHLINQPDDTKVCPDCGNPHLAKQCECDIICHCAMSTHETIAYCPICGRCVCPECGSSDVVALSRVTGYLQDVSGWNTGKRAELKDRHRYNVAVR